MGVKPTPDEQVERQHGSGLLALAEQWKKVGVATAIAATVFVGGMLVPFAGTGGADQANAAMAPSLMQDEKGYIAIFEKVKCVP